MASGARFYEGRFVFKQGSGSTPDDADATFAFEQDSSEAGTRLYVGNLSFDHSVDTTDADGGSVAIEDLIIQHEGGIEGTQPLLTTFNQAETLF
jgi:hypothetical protein